MRKMRKYRDYLIEKLSDRQEAIAYLQTALEEYQTDGDTAAFLLAVRTVVLSIFAKIQTKDNLKFRTTDPIFIRRERT